MKMSKNVCQKKKKGGKEKRGANLQLNNFIVTRRRAHPSQFSRVTWWEQLFNVKRNLNLLFQIRQIALNPAKECASQSCRLSYVGRKNFLNRLSTVVSAAVLKPITNQNEGSSAESTTKQSEPAGRRFCQGRTNFASSCSDRSACSAVYRENPCAVAKRCFIGKGV